MKKFIAMLLTVVAILISFAIADETPPVDKRLMLRLAITATAQMQANAINGQWNGTELTATMRLARYDFGHPIAAAIIELRPEQIDALCSSFGCDTSDLAPVLNTVINGQYSKSYTDIARRLSINYQPTEKTVHEVNTTAALLVYDYDMVLVIAYPNKVESAFYLISTKNIAQNFDAAYVEQVLSSVGLSEATFIVLTAQDIAILKSVEFLGSIKEERALVNAITASEKSVRLMLPDLLNCRLFDISSVAIRLTDTWLEEHDNSPEELLTAARFVKETIDPIVSEHKEYSAWLTTKGLDCDTMLDAALLPEMTFSDVVNESPICDGDKVIAIHRNERKNTVWLQGYLMAGMPLQHIPENLEDADWILLISTHWEEAGKSMGVTYYTAVSEISLHNAETGECVMYLGQQQDKLKGYINSAIK